MAISPAAVLFDLDGTLVDTIELIMRSMEYAFAEFDGNRPTRSEWLEGLGIPLRTLIAARVRTEAELDVVIARYRLFQGEHQDAMTRPYPGVAETLVSLTANGHPMGIVTSKFHAGARRALEHTGLLGHFGSVIGADSVENAKPHPEPVHRALTELGVSASNAFMVGDSPHDIAAGNAAGVRTIAVGWGPFSRERLERARPTHWISTFPELATLVAPLALQPTSPPAH
ncbi:MAG TPA: HAD-IA family hydrolase [Gemmatimonadaceae bacterium]|nr:HAD-IA family hydrolase [Gemmatimonadaceae bacterium]